MKLKLPNKDDVNIDMAPMIDMVFLLLIFFMVASVVKELDKREVSIPLSKYGKVPEDVKDRFMISVADGGDIYQGVNTKISLEQLKEMLVREMDPNQGGSPDLKVVIRADERVQYKTCKAIMRACADVEAMNIIYATFEEAGN